VSRPAFPTFLGALLLGMAIVAHGADGSMDRTERREAAQINAQLALTYLKQDNLPAARDKIEKALKQDPDTAGTQMAAGFVYDRLGQNDKAAGHFEQAVKLDRDNADVLNNAAVFLCRKGDRKKGESYFLRAATSPLYRTPEVAYSNAGRCARADGRPKDAERYYRQSLAIRPDQPDALLAMAGILHEDGNDLSARAFLQRYAAAAPATAESLWLGYQLETALGDQAAAGDYAQRLRTEFATSAQAAQLFEAERANP
jgi:type IV pilus assembly protein PilF